MANTAVQTNGQFLSRVVKGYSSLITNVQVNSPEWEVVKFLHSCVGRYGDNSPYLGIRFDVASYLAQEAAKGLQVPIPQLFWDAIGELDDNMLDSGTAAQYWSWLGDYNGKWAQQAQKIGFASLTEAERWVRLHTDTMSSDARRVECTDMTSSWRFPDGSGVVLVDGAMPWVLAAE